MSKRLWLWRNFVDGKPEYLAFDNAYPCNVEGDPKTLGSPCGYAVVQSSVNGRPEIDDDTVIAEIKRAINHDLLSENARLTARVAELREALEKIDSQYKTIMRPPPDWVNFDGPNDPRLKFAREAWYGASLIARAAIANTEPKK